MNSVVAICSVPWNCVPVTDKFVNMLRSATDYPYHLYLSDNSDKQHKIPGDDVTCVWNGGNVGFAKAINRVLKMAESDVIVVCNLDIRLPKGWLGKMLESYLATDYAILAPLMNSRHQLPWKWQGHTGTAEMLHAPIGALWMLSKSRLLDKTGYWDESFETVGSADLYHCWRAWQAGGRVGICTNVYVHHDAHGVTERNISHEEHSEIIQDVRTRLKEIYGPEFGGSKRSALRALGNDK